MSTTTTERERYQSEVHREHVFAMLEIAGREIARGWCEEAGLEPEELHELWVAAQGDIDFLDDLCSLLTGRPMPDGYHDRDSEEWKVVYRGIDAYAEETAE